jgi:hypothetical protein
MPTFNCSGCSITVAGNSLANYVVDMTLTLEMSTVEVTAVGDTDKFFVPGIRSGSASGNLYYNQDNTAVKALESARTSGAEVALVFTLMTGATYTTQALVTGFNPSMTHGEVVKAAVAFQFTGAVTISA